MKHKDEIETGQRFAFGDNWSRFLGVLNESRIQVAENSLRAMLEVETLAGLRFLDIGSGSGLFSLAARRLGAKVHSFDYDPRSVACTAELRRRYFPEDSDWVVEEGSALDTAYLQTLGTFDIVYSWGVLHHTGAMWEALDNVAPLVAKRGRLFIAIYNDQGQPSVMWKKIKKAYCAAREPFRTTILLLAFVRLWGPTTVRDLLKARPGATTRNYGKARGMSLWRDVVDWVGGYPFEVAKPEEVFDLFKRHGFELTQLKTCGGGHGCNEYVFAQTGRDMTRMESLACPELEK